MGEVRNHISTYIEMSQDKSVVIMKHGRPVAIIRGVAGMTIEEVMTEVALVNEVCCRT